MNSDLTITPSLPKGYFKVANFAIFQSVWCLGVFFGSVYAALSASLILLHFYMSPTRITDLRTLAIVAPIGIGVDIILTSQHIFVFDVPGIPLWLLLLWCGFSLTIVHSMSWIFKMPLALQALLGMFGGTSSYYAGYRFGAVDFAYPQMQTCLVLALVWGTKIPLFYFLVGRYAQKDS